VRSWLYETTEQFLLYILVGLGFVPFGIVYAVLRIHHQSGWYVLLPLMMGGVAVGFFIGSAVFRSPERDPAPTDHRVNRGVDPQAMRAR